MTREQARTLAFISDFTAEHGYSPSYQEIADHLGLASRSGAFRVVTALVKQGRVRKGAGYRELEVVWSQPGSTSPSRIATALAKAGFIPLAHQGEAALVIAASLAVKA